MTGIQKTMLLACVMMFLTAPAGVVLADWDEGEPFKWLQRPDLTPLGIDICVDDTGYGGRRMIGDDFQCTESGYIRGIHLWGSWHNDDVGEIAGITLRIWSDNPEGPQGHSEPLQELWSKQFGPDDFVPRLYHTMPDGEFEGWWDPRSGLGWIPNGDRQVWQINIEIDEETAFYQQGSPDVPIIYWLLVEVQLPPESQSNFGWKTRDRWDGHFMDDAVWHTPDSIPWHELKYPEGHEYYPDSIDMAFVLTGEPPDEDEGCCIDGYVCLDMTPAECRANGGVPQGPGSFCTVDETCCINGGATCVDVDPLCCDDLGGTPSPLGEAACLGDGNGDGFDDACVKPGCFLRALFR